MDARRQAFDRPALEGDGPLARREIAAGLTIGLPAIGGVPPSYVPSSVTVDADGTIFATGDAGNVLYRITRR